jgi:predicted Ser/Thr protein kinase
MSHEADKPRRERPERQGIETDETVAGRDGAVALDATAGTDSAVGSAATMASGGRVPDPDQTAPNDSAVGSAATVASGGRVPDPDQTAPNDSAVGSAATVASGGRVPDPDQTAPSDSVLAAAGTVASDQRGRPSLLRPPQASRGRFRAGERFGPFEVLELLGEGGMGVVFAAHDPDLERKVAIKVLRGRSKAPEAQLRLLREAQAMAQLAHPHVITVHQVGTRDDEVFVVMEYVDGGTLRDWVAAEPRGWREVLAVYRGAGQGLAAAHKAGLVHRDFKPDNVLIRSDGRVVVTDFGLVATVGATNESAPMPQQLISSPSNASSSKLAVQLTRTGEVMGTPLYMAPEQHRGARADARADQFAFCVALFEALYGMRPFGGQTYEEVVQNVLQEPPRKPPEQTKVPGWVHEVVRRGLRSSPDERFPDMDALLEGLARDPAAVRRRRWLAAGAVASVLAVAGLSVALVFGKRPRSTV